MPYGYDVANAQIPQAANPIDSIAKGLTSGIDLGFGLQRAKQDANLNELRMRQVQQEIDQKKSDDDLRKFSELTSFYKNLKNPRNKEIFYENGIKPLAEKIFGSELPSMLDDKTSSYFDDAGELSQHLKDKKITIKDYKLGLQALYLKALKEGDEESAKGLLDASRMVSEPQQQGSYTFAGTDNSGNLVGINNKTFETKIAPSPTGKPLLPKNVTDVMANSSLYATRAEDANKQLDGLIQKGFDPTSLSSGVQKLLPNYFQGENAQALEQIGRNFGAAVLRKESGAAITKDEWDQVKLQYIPQPGDKPETLAQKALNRERAIQGLGQMGAKLPELSNSLIKSFKSEKEAESANLPSGTIIEINGRKARVK